jgi:hypothetical protein
MSNPRKQKVLIKDLYGDVKKYAETKDLADMADRKAMTVNRYAPKRANYKTEKGYQRAQEKFRKKMGQVSNLYEEPNDPTGLGMKHNLQDQNKHEFSLGQEVFKCKNCGRHYDAHGGSWFTDVFTKHIPNAAKAVHGAVKKYGLVSKALKYAPSIIPGQNILAQGAEALGYGMNSGGVLIDNPMHPDAMQGGKIKKPRKKRVIKIKAKEPIDFVSVKMPLDRLGRPLYHASHKHM